MAQVIMISLCRRRMNEFRESKREEADKKKAALKIVSSFF
jgi:hypothetical protein